MAVEIRALFAACFVGGRRGIGCAAEAHQTVLVQGDVLLFEHAVEVAHIGADEGVVFTGHGAGFVDDDSHVQRGGGMQYAAHQGRTDDAREQGRFEVHVKLRSYARQEDADFRYGSTSTTPALIGRQLVEKADSRFRWAGLSFSGSTGAGADSGSVCIYFQLYGHADAGPQGPGTGGGRNQSSWLARKLTAIIAMARLPTTRALSSTKNSGLWLGAAVAGSWPSGVIPRETYRPGASWAKKEKSSAAPGNSAVATLPSAARSSPGAIYATMFKQSDWPRWGSRVKPNV